MIDLKRYTQVTNKQLWTYTGMVTRIIGMGIESIGPISNIGDVCVIETKTGNREVFAEVVGFKDEHVLLMPLADLQGIGAGCKVKSYGDKLSVKVGFELLGHVVNWRAEPLTGEELHCEISVPMDNEAPNPLTRNRIKEQLYLGVKAIDGMLSVGKGQRIGIFAGSGVGKVL
nr:hypothetical protein [Sporanaerobium hydrogeniformans]